MARKREVDDHGDQPQIHSGGAFLKQREGGFVDFHFQSVDHTIFMLDLARQMIVAFHQRLDRAVDSRFSPAGHDQQFFLQRRQLRLRLA